MAIENPIQTDTIPELNEEWPIGSDAFSNGDDHLRLIKKVLKATFPTLTGPVTATLEAINRGAVPIGSRCLFYQAAAPTGWVRVPGIVRTAACRIVPTETVGGITGGNDDPVLNDKIQAHTHENIVPAHKHRVIGNTGSSEVPHDHNVSIEYNYGAFAAGPYPVHAHLGPSNFKSSLGIGTSHAHAIDLWSADASNLTSNTGAIKENMPKGVWAPRYADFVLCERTS